MTLVYSAAGEAAFASPIYDFLYMISSARRLKERSRVSTRFSYSDLAEILEKKIILGQIDFEDDEPRQVETSETRPAKAGCSAEGELTAASVTHTSDGIELALHASASIVGSLAGLDIYLKKFCDRGGLLVIDEPEMNAHPEAQLKIIEFLALMVHHGVRVVLTTHSPYIVDHLSNLMQASQLGKQAKEAIAPQFKLGRREAFLSPGEISVYLFNEVGRSRMTFSTESKESST